MEKPRSVFRRGLRVIGSYIRTHPLPFGVAVSGAAVYATMTVGSTYVLGWVTDGVILPAFADGVSLGAIVGGALAIAAVGVIRAVGILFRRYFAGMTATRMQATLRRRVVDRYQELPLAYHRVTPTGELLAHAQADVDAATEVIHPLPFSTAVVLLVVFATASLVVTDPFLAIIGLTILPVMAVLNRVYNDRVEGPATRAQERIAEVSAVAHESIDGALMVKTLGREQAEAERLAARAQALRTERVQIGRMRAFFEPAIDMMPTLGIIVLLAVGSWRISTGAITAGTLVRFISLFQLLAFPMRLIGWLLADIPRAVVGRQRLEKVFTTEVTLAPAAENLPLPDGDLGISVRDVSFSYDAAAPPVLDGLSLEVAPLESVAVVGSTGAGKSTLVQLLVRLADPAYGSVRLGGVDVRHVAAEHLSQAAGVVFQESFLFATTIRDNITLGLPAKEADVRRAAALAQAHDFIIALPHGYDTVVGERGVTLSGGQRQRVALARALVRRPRLLILDDATSAVDPTVEAAILDGLRRELRGTLVVVAYRVSTISLADRVVFLEGGRIAASGPHHELLAYPSYAAMVRAYEVGGVAQSRRPDGAPAGSLIAGAAGGAPDGSGMA